MIYWSISSSMRLFRQPFRSIRLGQVTYYYPDKSEHGKQGCSDPNAHLSMLQIEIYGTFEKNGETKGIVQKVLRKTSLFFSSKNT